MTSLSPLPPRHRRPVERMRIGFIGGETVAAALSPRLVAQGHAVVSFHRSSGPGAGNALPWRRICASGPIDVAFLSNPAQSAALPAFRALGIPAAVHVDGHECGDRVGGRIDRVLERLAVREADALVTSTRLASAYFDDEFDIPTQFVGLGGPLIIAPSADTIDELDLRPKGYHLTELACDGTDRADVVLEAFHRSAARLPLVVVGDAAPGSAAAASIAHLAARDPRIRLLGHGLADDALDSLHAYALSSLHAHEGSAVPASMLRAMGSGTAIAARGTAVNREIVGTAGSYFSNVMELAREIDEIEDYPFRFREIGELMQERVARLHDWDVVAERYSTLASRLARGFSTRGMRSGRLKRGSDVPTPRWFRGRRD